MVTESTNGWSWARSNGGGEDEACVMLQDEIIKVVAV